MVDAAGVAVDEVGRVAGGVVDELGYSAVVSVDEVGSAVGVVECEVGDAAGLENAVDEENKVEEDDAGDEVNEVGDAVGFAVEEDA